jgi:hypothetical protein
MRVDDQALREPATTAVELRRLRELIIRPRSALMTYVGVGSVLAIFTLVLALSEPTFATYDNLINKAGSWRFPSYLRGARSIAGGRTWHSQLGFGSRSSLSRKASPSPSPSTSTSTWKRCGPQQRALTGSAAGPGQGSAGWGDACVGVDPDGHQGPDGEREGEGAEGRSYAGEVT